MQDAANGERDGVKVPLLEGHRSSSRLGTTVVAQSLAGVDDGLAASLDAGGWRRSYRAALASATKLAVNSKAGVTMAEQGLASLHTHVVHEDGDTVVSLSDWRASTAGADTSALGSVVLHGEGDRLAQVEVPYRGEVLRGDALLRQLDAWVVRGVVEPGFADAVGLAVRHPEWLSMPERRVTLVGAAAAMGPLETLSRWGANIVAVDVPVDAVWRRIAAVAAKGAGAVTAPTSGPVPGVHVGKDLAELRPWLRARHADGPVPVLGVYAYADGAAHVEAVAAADVLTMDLMDDRSDGVLCFLNTPTDAFLVPEYVIETARQRWDALRFGGLPHATARTLSAGKLFRPAYAQGLRDELGDRWGLVDTLVDVQGPNYALAKRAHRWRATAAHHGGYQVSTTVAPASWTRSVTKNRALASVYAAAHRFDVEIFDAGTVAPLLAAKLVADTFAPVDLSDAHVEAIFSHDAAHGGLWRQPYEPASALGLAGLMGAPKTFLTRRGD
jgi:hypothetical protein